MDSVDKNSTREVLSQVPAVLRALMAENVKLAAALEDHTRQDEAEDLVSIMDAKGVTDRSVPFKKKVAALLASKKDLNVVREALSLTTPDMSFASLSDDGPSGGDSTNAFENFILGD